MIKIGLKQPESEFNYRAAAYAADADACARSARYQAKKKGAGK